MLDLHLADQLGNELGAALGAASLVQRAQRFALGLRHPPELVVMQLADALRVLADEVLLLERARLLGGHRFFPSRVSARPASASRASLARSCAGDSRKVSCSSFCASPARCAFKYAMASRKRKRALPGAPLAAPSSFST